MVEERKSAPGSRTRKNNGPAVLKVTEVTDPNPKDLGTLTRYTREIIEGGPRALIAAQHRAAKLAEKFGEEIQAQWCLKTTYLTHLPLKGKDGRDMTALNRLKVQFAMAWRPRFLACLALSGGTILAARAAKVSINMVREHRKIDHDFETQCQEAEMHAVELLHDVTMQSALEGDIEPVYWQGIKVGHVRKIDNRLRIEMLRAKMPNVFKMPGAKIAINTGTLVNTQGGQIVDTDEQDRLIQLRQESLRRLQERRHPALPAPSGAD